MQELEVTVDFNGIVLFDPEALKNFYSEIDIGTNLYFRFTRTDDGDAVVQQGIIIPIIGINDSIYKVFLRFSTETSKIDPTTIIASNGDFPFRVNSQAVITDMASLLEWDPTEDWPKLELPAGNYSARINGFRVIKNNEIADFGFEIVFTTCDVLPAFTGSLATNMQVLELPINK